MSEENYEEVKPKNFKFGMVGDYMKGTLLKVDQTTKPDQWGKLSKVYTVKAIEGTFHNSVKNEKTGKFVLDEKPTIVNNNEEYTIFVSLDKGPVISKMKDVRIGQKFMIKFDELKPTDKGNDAKLIKVMVGKDKEGKPIMDEEWMKENESMDDFEGKKPE